MADRSGAVLHWPAAFIKWWTEELLGLLPAAHRSSALTGRSCLILVLEGDEIVLFERTAQRGEREIGRRNARDDDDTAREAEAKRSPNALAALGRRRYRKWPLILRLPSHLGLRKLVDLPLKARQDLAALLQFELDRLTPFKADDVHFAWRIMETDSKSERMRVALELAPKPVIDEAVEIAAICGRDVDRVELEAGPDREQPLDLLPSDRENKAVGGWLNRTLAFTTLVLLVTAAGLPMKEQIDLLAELNAEIAALRVEAEESLALRQRLDLVSDEASFFARADDERATMTELLAELTRLLPDHSHLRQLRITDSAVELNGLTEEPSELVAVLDRSPMLTSPTFSSPVIRDRQSGQDLFQISASFSGGPH